MDYHQQRHDRRERTIATGPVLLATLLQQMNRLNDEQELRDDTFENLVYVAISDHMDADTRSALLYTLAFAEYERRRLNQPQPCSTCEGAGTISRWARVLTCTGCNGTGNRPVI